MSKNPSSENLVPGATQRRTVNCVASDPDADIVSFSLVAVLVSDSACNNPGTHEACTVEIYVAVICQFHQCCAYM